MATLLTKKSDTASSVPLAADLTNAAGGAELAVNTADKRLYSKTSGGTVVELGTNPSSMTLPSGTANGVPYLNGSKVLTSGSALQFDGTNLGLGATPSAWGSGQKAIDVNGAGVMGAGVNGYFASNAYFNAGWKYKTSSTVALYSQEDGVHKWNIAASGTAGNAISFTQAMTLDASGNLLVGANSSSTAYIAVANGGLTSNGSSVPLKFGIDGTERARIDSSGWFRFTQSTATGYLGSAASISGGSANEFCVRSDNALTFATGGASERARIDSSGNLLVGTTTSGGRLTVRLDSTTASPQYIINAAATGTFIKFEGNGSVLGSITFNGSNTAYNTTSDRRLKNNVRPANAAKFMDIEFVDFEWVDGRHDCGVIAEQLQTVYPDLVLGKVDATEVRTVEITPAVPAVLDAEGNEVSPEVPAVTEEQTFPVYQQVNYTGLIGRMGTRVQMLQRTVDAQAALIAMMEARLAALEAK